jgi:hypothetical protein
MKRLMARTAITIGCLAIFAAANHIGAQKVANYRCAHNIGSPCRSAR